MRDKSIWLVFALVALAILAVNSLFVVKQTERAVVLRFGKMVTLEDNEQNPQIIEPGLNFKLPFVDRAKFIDARLNTLELKSSEIPTAEKKNVLVDLYVKWRVKDFGKFYIRTNASLGWDFAQNKLKSLLTQKTIDGVRSEIGRRTITEVVSQERKAVMERIQKDVAGAAAELGIEIIDIRIKKIDLPDQVSEAVYNLMRTERQKEAVRHRAQGHRKAEEIRANADAQREIIISEAKKKANIIMGEADAKAAKIYAQAYNQDKEFYAFTKSLDAYKNIFSTKDDLLVLSLDGELFEYMKSNNTKELP